MPEIVQFDRFLNEDVAGVAEGDASQGGEEGQEMMWKHAPYFIPLEVLYSIVLCCINFYNYKTKTFH